MTGETRPVCVYALAGLKRSSSRLMVVMCVGIALALYGIYVQARTQSNPEYMPSIAVATNWFYKTFGQRLPGKYLQACMGSSGRHPFKATIGQLIMYRFIYPIMRYSGFVNGMVNLGQIFLLRAYCRSITATDAIIGLSSFGLLISMICLVGSFASCKLMCFSCLGIHHMVIIYLAIRRRKALKNILCPTENLGACTFGNSSGGGGASAATKRGSGSGTGSGIGSIISNGIGLSNKPKSNSNMSSNHAAKHASSCTTRRRPEASERRRSDRI